MANFSIKGVRLAGIAVAVPPGQSDVQPAGMAPAPELKKIIANTGVKSRRVADTEICTSDLCAAASQQLLDRVGWERSSIDMLILVTQTPDYVLPATACSLHGRLGLAKSCSAFDINLGCSGYVYGLSVAAAYVHAGAARRVLLLVGDTISRVVSAEDRSTAFLFGDAGTATALEAVADGTSMHFVTGSDGNGSKHLEIPAGMFRSPSRAETRTVSARESGNARNDEQLHMNGPEIFNFTLREVPGMIGNVLEAAAWRVEEVDGFVLHQANRFMLDYLSKRMKLPADKVVLALEQFGNTSSASIPLAICARLRERLLGAPARLVLAGFGVGFSWASAAITVDRPHIEPIIEYLHP